MPGSSRPAAPRRQAECQFLAIHAPHALQAPVDREDEDTSLHQRRHHGRARLQRERLALGYAQSDGHAGDFKPLVDKDVKLGGCRWPRWRPGRYSSSCAASPPCPRRPQPPSGWPRSGSSCSRPWSWRCRCCRSWCGRAWSDRGGPILLLWLMLAAMVLVDLAGRVRPLGCQRGGVAAAGAAGCTQSRPQSRARRTRPVRLAPAVGLCRMTCVYQLVAEPAAVAHGYDGIVHYNPTGSVVMQQPQPDPSDHGADPPEPAAACPCPPRRWLWAPCRCRWSSRPPPARPCSRW